MAQESVERLIGRLLTDDQFRGRVARNLALTCHEEGYHLSEEEQRLILRMDLQALSAISGNIDGGIKRFSTTRSYLTTLDTEEQQTIILN